MLIDSASDWNDHASLLLQLLGQRLRNFVRGATDNDRVEGSDFRPAFITVARLYMRVSVTQTRQSGRRLFRERLEDLD